MRVMIVVTHLLGTGHLSRALTLGRAFADAGHQAHVVSGGFPAPHLDTTGVTLHQLSPVRSDGVDFARLLDGQGLPVDDSLRAERINHLTALLGQITPDALITELFPFGRRTLRHEFLSLLEAAHHTGPRPVVLASIRDILAPPSKPARADQTEGWITTFYDGVLVHADPSVVALDRSWPVSDAIGARLLYTGFVTGPAPDPHPDAAGAGEVLVSAGGGAVGAPLFEAAIAAQRIDGQPWRLLVGGADAPVTVAKIMDQAGPGLVAEPVRPDFRSMLRHARASISQCGYNTALDLLQTGVPAVLVPFDAGGEVEQTRRATALAAQPGMTLLPTKDLSGPALVAALRQVTADPARDPGQFDMAGAAKTVEITRKLVAER